MEAAAQVVALTGDVQWLRRDVAGQPLIERLDLALSGVLAHRTSAQTADCSHSVQAAAAARRTWRTRGLMRRRPRRRGA